MATKAKIPPYTPALIIAIFLAAVFGFHMLRDRSSLNAALKQKEFEIASLQEQLNNLHKEVVEQQETISLLTDEKARLATDTDGLKLMLEKYKGSDDDKKQVLQDSLQSKEDEVDELKEQVAKLEHSKENVEELRQQVRELEKKLAQKVPADKVEESRDVENSDLDEDQHEINLDKDSGDDEADGKQSSNLEDETDDADLVDKGEHSDEGVLE